MAKYRHILAKTALILYLLFLGCTSIYGQNLILDSLQQLLPTVTNLKDSIDILYNIGNLMVEKDEKESQLILKQINQLAEQSDYLKAKVYALELERDIHLNKGNYKKALKIGKKVVRLCQQYNLKDDEARGLNSIGICFYETSRYDSSMFYIIKAMDIFEALGNKKRLASGYYNIGILAEQGGNEKKAIEYKKKALEMKIEIAPESNLASNYQGLATAYYHNRQYEKAIPIFLKGLEYAEKFDDQIQQIIIYNNLGANFKFLNRHNEALNSFLNAYKLCQTNNEPRLEGYALNGLSVSYYHLKDFEKADHYARQLVAHADTIGNLELATLAQKQLAFVAAGLQQFDSAFYHYEQFKFLEDSVAALKNISTFAELETKYKTGQQEKELLQKELELERKDKLRNQIIGGSILLILFLTGIFQYLRYRSRLRRKEAELALQLEHAEADKLRELDLLRTRFFANISHEFRTPLTLIKGLLQNAEKILGSKINQRPAEVSIPAKYVRMMRRNADRLLQLVNQLLDLSKLEAGRMKLEAGQGDIVRFVRRVVASFESLADQKEICFEQRFPKESITAYFDKDKLEKILINLLSNAFKFTQEEGKISIVMKSNPSEVSIAVADTGFGISQDEVSNVFNRFYSRDSKNMSNSEQGSTGIGLALTKELVELHHGKITAESQLNKGSIFIITLPLGEKAFKRGGDYYFQRKSTSGRNGDRFKTCF